MKSNYVQFEHNSKLLTSSCAPWFIVDKLEPKTGTYTFPSIINIHLDVVCVLRGEFLFDGQPYNSGPEVEQGERAYLLISHYNNHTHLHIHISVSKSSSHCRWNNLHVNGLPINSSSCSSRLMSGSIPPRASSSSWYLIQTVVRIHVH